MFPVLNYLIINKGFLISSNREDSSIFIEIQKSIKDVILFPAMRHEDK